MIVDVDFCMLYYYYYYTNIYIFISSIYSITKKALLICMLTNFQKDKKNSKSQILADRVNIMNPKYFITLK